MAKTSMLRDEDWRSIFRLAGECRDLGDDATAWRDHLVRGLARLIDADLGSSGETVGHAGGPLRSVGVVNWGFDHFTSPKVYQAVFAQVLADPHCYDLVERWNAEQAHEDGAASTRRKLVEDREWYASTSHDLIHRPLGVDHVVACWRTTPGHVRIGSTLFRGRGRRDFGEREVAIVHEVHAELAALVGGPLARFEEPSPRDLPPHMRRVLACLLEGDGDKQVAARLGLSAHSVNQYTKGLYRHLGVRSRAELLARWLRRAYPNPPAWLE